MKAETQAPGVLSAILAATRARLAPRLGDLADWERRARAAPRPPDFAACLRGGPVALIAEVKRRSPSAGGLDEGADAAARAAAYRAGGAAAISVLTEPERFGGSLDDLAAVAALGVPALRKDFIVHELQVFEARAVGAAAVLLIARALPAARLAGLVALARELGLAALVEVHADGELDAALAAGAEVVGVNARDLETLAMDAGVVARLLPRVPSGLLAVAESGLAARADLERVAAAGADAVLVGTALMRAADPSAALASLGGVPRRPRGGG